MRIGDKPPAGDDQVEIAPPGGSFRKLGAPAAGEELVTLGEDLYGILCELLDSVPLETQLGIATAFQSRPHPAFEALSLDVREAFEAGAAAFDSEDDDDDESDDDEETEDDETE